MHYSLNEIFSFKQGSWNKVLLNSPSVRMYHQLHVQHSRIFFNSFIYIPSPALKSAVFRAQYTIFSYLIHIFLDRFLEADQGDKPISYKMPHVI